MIRRTLVVTLCAAGLSAQGLVSPTVSANVEGAASNTFPFASNVARRYMQIHSDRLQTPFTVTKLSFRQDDGGDLFPTGVRAVDLELLMGHGSTPAGFPSLVFDANWSGKPTRVMTRKVVNFGPCLVNLPIGPTPFAKMDLTLDAPFVYTANQKSLVWEADVFAVTSSGGTFNALDADQASHNSATVATTGTGCIATGQSQPMTHTVDCSDMSFSLLFGVSAQRCPASSQVFLALGITNPNALIPGVCSRALTDMLVVLSLGTSNASGALTNDVAGGFIVQNHSGGKTLQSQLHAIDLNRADPFKVCNSDGHATTFPFSNTSKFLNVTRLFNNTGGTAATQSAFFSDSTVGFALVTRFQ